MRRALLLVPLALFIGCGAAAKSPVAEEKSPQSSVEKTGMTEKIAEPEPAAKPVAAKPPGKFAELEPPDAPPAGPAPSARPALQGTELALPHIRLTVPGTWVVKKPDVAVLLAEFALPRAAGDDADGRLTIATAAGGVKQVAAKWRDSFGGKPEKESQEEPQILGVWVRLVDMSGTYRTRTNQSAPYRTFPNYRLLGAICDVGDQNQMYFIKAVGPAKTIAAHAGEFRAFLESIRLKQ